MQVIYNYSGSSAQNLSTNYAKIVREEFYDGDLEMDPSPHFDVIFEKAFASPMALLRVKSSVGISYRRAWNHIRSNNTGVRVIWFVHKGTLKLVRSHHSCTINPGQAGILDSSLPFFAHATPDQNDCFEATQAIVPSHLFLSHLPAALDFNRSFAPSPMGHEVINKLLDLLFGEGGKLGRGALEPLAIGFLEALAEEICLHSDGIDIRKQSVLDKRLDDIQSCIMQNFTDPELTYEDVAQKCGISPRYLCYVLKANNTSFSSLLWNYRLPNARDWLAVAELQNYRIHEIAFMAGFKSAAHFSRMFKAHYGCSPREFRRQAEQRTSMPEARRLPSNDA